ncbi:hypothetical protein D2N39_11655 [Gemmobacter lutimaris]|uniref:Uncharacterized protein n=1 Tax=Gemmobacter lutimaris TaxID=2306023 RepID=A0A398BQ98_9RHOB|nr:hypothetical protein [Gemmobacter lutimaris]RID91884.1 hypothetical protein D2N39_11655 [Gemmobacter lutimaris]
MTIGTAKARNANIVPLAFNWRNGVELQLDYKTEIRQFRDGSEERDCLRAVPRAFLRGQARATRALARQFRADMIRGRNDEWSMAFPGPYRALTAAAMAGSVTIELDAVPHWIVPGASLILSDGAATEARAVSSVAGAVVTLDAPLVFGFAAGAKVHRAYPVRFTQDPAMENRTDETFTLSINTAIVPGRFSMPGTGHVFPQYSGRDLFLKRPNWGEAISHTATALAEVIDFDIGVTQTVDRFGFVADTVSATFYGLGYDEVDELFQFVARRLGRRNSFWAPSPENDFELIEAVPGTSVLGVAGDWFEATFAGSITHNRIIAFFDDGSYAIHSLTGEFPAAPEGQSRFGVTPSLGAKFNANTKVRWLNRRRLASDSITFSFITDSNASVVLPMSVLPTSGA